MHRSSLQQQSYRLPTPYQPSLDFPIQQFLFQPLQYNYAAVLWLGSIWLNWLLAFSGVRCRSASKKTGRCISLSQKLSRYIQSPEIQGEILLNQTDSTPLLFLMLIYGHELNQVKYQWACRQHIFINFQTKPGLSSMCHRNFEKIFNFKI